MKEAVLIKICGNVFRDQALMTAKAGPDLMGWIFASVSPRYIKPADAASVIHEIRICCPDIRHVGVFAENSVNEILSAAAEAGEGTLDFLQVHGGPALTESLRSRLPQAKIIPVIPVDPEGRELTDSDLDSYGPAPYYLFDTYSKKAPGGTGIRFPLSHISKITKPYFVAGGLNPENVSEVLQNSEAAGLDVSSGLELSPGIKDPEKLKKFIEIIRGRR